MKAFTVHLRRAFPRGGRQRARTDPRCDTERVQHAAKLEIDAERDRHARDQPLPLVSERDRKRNEDRSSGMLGIDAGDSRLELGLNTRTIGEISGRDEIRRQTDRISDGFVGGHGDRIASQAYLVRL